MTHEHDTAVTDEMLTIIRRHVLVEDGDDALRVALEAALSSRASAEPVRVTIKPLEWEPTSKRIWEADSVLGAYRVMEENPSVPDVIPCAWRRYNSSWVKTGSVEEAKAAAQADYEARIRSALVALPSVSELEGEISDEQIRWIVDAKDVASARARLRAALEQART